jgi:hypothetical protein
MLLTRIVVLLVLGALSLPSLAASTTNTEKNNCPPMEHPRHEPPPSAFDDCKGKAEGAAIQHTTPNGDKVSAFCVNSPNGLFARPEHPPRSDDGLGK